MADRPAECRVCDQNWGEGARTWDPPGWPARERRRQGVSRRSDHLCQCLLPTQRPWMAGTPSERARPTPQMPSPTRRGQGWQNTPSSREESPQKPTQRRRNPTVGLVAARSPAFSCPWVWGLVTPLPRSPGVGGGGREAHRSVQAGWGLPLPPPVQRPLPRSKSEKQAGVRVKCLPQGAGGWNAGASEPRPHRNRAAISCRRRKQPCHPQESHQPRPVPFDLRQPLHVPQDCRGAEDGSDQIRPEPWPSWGAVQLGTENKQEDKHTGQFHRVGCAAGTGTVAFLGRNGPGAVPTGLLRRAFA